MSKGNDILECVFLDRRLNRIFILAAASLVLISIVAIGVFNNMGLDNAKGKLWPPILQFYSLGPLKKILRIYSFESKVILGSIFFHFLSNFG